MKVFSERRSGLPGPVQGHTYHGVYVLRWWHIVLRYLSLDRVIEEDFSVFWGRSWSARRKAVTITQEAFADSVASSVGRLVGPGFRVSLYDEAYEIVRLGRKITVIVIITSVNHLDVALAEVDILDENGGSLGTALCRFDAGVPALPAPESLQLSAF